MVNRHRTSLACITGCYSHNIQIPDRCGWWCGWACVEEQQHSPRYVEANDDGDDDDYAFGRAAKQSLLDVYVCRPVRDLLLPFSRASCRRESSKVSVSPIWSLVKDQPPSGVDHHRASACPNCDTRVCIVRVIFSIVFCARGSVHLHSFVNFIPYKGRRTWLYKIKWIDLLDVCCWQRWRCQPVSILKCDLVLLRA